MGRKERRDSGGKERVDRGAKAARGYFGTRPLFWGSNIWVG